MHRFITAAFIAYAVLTNACMFPVASAAVPEVDPHAHHDASHIPGSGENAHHASDCAHGHCFGHALPAAIAEDGAVHGCSHDLAVPEFAAFPSMFASLYVQESPPPRPDPPGRIRTVVLRY